MLQRFLALLATTPGLSSTPQLLSSEGDSRISRRPNFTRISRRPNFTPSREAPLQQTHPGVQGLAKAWEPLMAPISPSLCRAAWGTAAHVAAVGGGPCPQQPHHPSKVGTPKAPPHPEEQELILHTHLQLPPTLGSSLAVPGAGKELCWEASAVPAAPAGNLFLLYLSLLPFPGFWHSKIRQKVSYLSSFCVLVVNALENLPTWLVLRISSTQAISNPIPSKY